MELPCRPYHCRQGDTPVTLTNRDVFAIDPTEPDIPNLGVAKVKNPKDDRDWATLEWELRSFVCDGEYERGLERILDQFLSHLGGRWLDAALPVITGAGDAMRTR